MKIVPLFHIPNKSTKHSRKKTPFHSLLNNLVKSNSNVRCLLPLTRSLFIYYVNKKKIFKGLIISAGS